MTEKLKPCPFCGSDRTTIWNAGGGQQAVCKDCLATGPVFTCDEAWRQAFTAWNIRAAERCGEPVLWALFNPATGRYRARAFSDATLAKEAARTGTDNYTALIVVPLYLATAPRAKTAPKCELCNDTGVWPTADGVGHCCSCGAAA